VEKRQTAERGGGPRTRVVIAALTVLVAGTVFAWWRVDHADRRLRGDLLLRARLAARSIDPAQVAALAGSEADLDSPDYLRLKAHLATVRGCDPQCRFLYLMGRRPDGTIFFHVDSQPVGGKDEAPAGLAYDEAPARLHAVFAAAAENIEGPYTDRWGRLVSAFIPLRDAPNGELVAVMGMDVDASRWRAQIFSESALPVLLLVIAVLIGSFCALLAAANRRIRESRETIRIHGELQEVAAAVSSNLVDISDLDRRIDEALRDVGLATAADRAHIFRVCDDGTVEAAYEWCAEGVEPQKGNLKGIPPGEAMPWFWPRMLEGETLQVPAVCELPPEAEKEKALWDMLGVQSMLAVPMATDGCLAGFLSFCRVRTNGAWSEDAVALLRMTGETLARAMARHRAEEALHRSEMHLRALSDASFEAVFLSEKGVCLGQNCTAGRMFGYTDEEAGGRMGTEWIAPEDRDTVMQHMQEGAEGPYEVMALRKDGSEFPVQIQARMIQYQGRRVRVTALRDITERRRTEEERARLRAQLVQAQKMEAIGKLAGGIAHDFNNLLMGILNYVDLCRDTLPPEHAIRTYLDEIATDANRSADLTRQLLAFARRQTIEPRTMNINAAVSGMLKMLRRLIGEDIDLTWLPGTNLWTVVMDPSQVDQLLANLTVNARDAISGVGKITITTQNTTLNNAYCAEHGEAAPGEYVLLSVTDNGYGMDEETRSKIFDPFFTTKGVGKGTGLGLATVYGVVMQNKGSIDVSSRPGQGTTFQIYLPRGTATAHEAPREPPGQQGGHETILLVEDERSLRVTIRAFLTKLGYRVWTAERPEEALAVAEKNAGEIHLLITDVVMPGMNGRSLAERLRRDDPDLKCIFMSGYPTDALADRGLVEDGVNFLGKPFPREALAHKVREVLEG
jgi:PAS domain S-box-containing protein